MKELIEDSNLDDRYENGSHDYLKFIKFGYGRATDHSSKDILTGYISREKGIEYVKKHDHVIPSDLNHWLKYVGMKKKIFTKKQIHLDQIKYGGLKKSLV